MRFDPLPATPPFTARAALTGLIAGGDQEQLNRLFRQGRPPDPPLDGVYAGRVLALDLAPGLTALAAWLMERWMPWRGKTFDAARARGDNVLHHDAWTLTRLCAPGYRLFTPYGARHFRAFPFRTSLGPGREDPDRQVLRIDYDLPVNPRWSVRRVRDEVTQIAAELYLGKAHLRWWRGRWRRVGFFLLDGAIELAP